MDQKISQINLRGYQSFYGMKRMPHPAQEFRALLIKQLEEGKEFMQKIFDRLVNQIVTLSNQQLLGPLPPLF